MTQRTNERIEFFPETPPDEDYIKAILNRRGGVH
jgi:hypothetical protein